METPQEVEVWYVLPALRKSFAEELRKLGLKQKEIAAQMHVSEAAISQYLKSKRATKVKFTKDIAQEITKSAKKISEKKAELRDYLVKKVTTEISDVVYNGSKTKRICNNASLSFNYIEGEGLLLHLSMEGICVSTGSACAAKDLKISYVLTAIGLPAEIAHGTLRISLSHKTTKKEIDYTVKKLKQTVKKLRDISPLSRRKK